MITLSMDRIVTYSQDLGNGFTAMWDSKYKDLEKHLHNVHEITVSYPYGQMNRRVKQLEKLGFKVKETIYHSDPEIIWSRTKQVWSR